MGCGGLKSEPIPPGTADGQVLVWDGDDWVPSSGLAGVSLVFGSLNFGNVTSGSLNSFTGESGALAFASRTANYMPIVGPVLWRRIGYRGVTALPPSDLTVELRINDAVVDTLIIPAATGVGSKVLNVQAATDDFVGITFTLAGATDLSTRRPRVALYGVVL